MLRKIGFDLETVQSTAKYSEFMLSLNPQVLIISSSGKKVDLSVIQKDLKKRQRPPKTVLLVNPSQDLEDLPFIDVDVILSSPVKIDKLIDAIADQLGVDPTPYLNKFNKLNMSNTEAAQDEDSNNDLKVMQEFGEALQIVKGGKPKEDNISVSGKLSQQNENQMISSQDSKNSDLQKNNILSRPINEEPQSNSKVRSTGLERAKDESQKTSGIGINNSESDLNKISGRNNSQNMDELNTVTGSSLPTNAIFKISPSSISEAERTKRYSKLLESVQLPKDAKFSREFVANQNKALRAQEKKTALIDLEEERKRFVKKLFEK